MAAFDSVLRRVVWPGAALAWIAVMIVYAACVRRAETAVALSTERLFVPMLAGLSILLLAIVWSGAMFGVLSLLRRFTNAGVRVWEEAVCFTVAPALLCLAIVGDRSRLPVPPPGEPEVMAQGPTIVLLTLDTFRADHVGVLGGGDLTPNLDAFAKSATLFTQAITTAPLTGPAHSSMLTGLDVSGHQFTRNGGHLQTSTIVERLRAAGYRTGAFVSAAVLDSKSGLSQGFMHYDDRLSVHSRLASWPVIGRWMGKVTRERRGDITVARALSWLDSDTRPAFLWVHLYDAHGPYHPPSSFLPAGDEVRRARELDNTRRPKHGLHRESDIPSDIERSKLMYNGEVRWINHLVGELLAHLDDDSIVIVTGDHGESLDEHGYYFNHGATLWEQSLRVPLIVKKPGDAASGTQVSTLASIQGIASTLLWAAGLAPRQESLLALADAPRDNAVLAYTSGQEARHETFEPFRRHEARKPKPVAALRLDGAKLLAKEGEVRYFDLRADPEEAKPQPIPEALQAQAQRVRELAEKLPPPPSPDEVERMRALGYVE